MTLIQFIREAWHVLEPGRAFVDNWHIELICDALERVSRGEITRLAINIPPGMMKSLIVSVFWPVWEWTFSAEKQFVCVTHDDKLTARDADKMRDLVKSAWFQSHWPNVQIRVGSDEKKLFKNTANGFRFSSTVRAGITGWRGDRLIIDDAISAQDVSRIVEREFVTNWYRTEATSRINDEGKSAIVIIGQRLHEDDIFGTLEELGGFEWIVLPNEYNPTDIKTTVGRDPRTEAGELLFPLRLSKFGSAAKNLELGAADYGAQYNQNPIPLTGHIFEPTWWRFWKRSANEPIGKIAAERFSLLPASFGQKVISVDATFSDSKTSDNVALQVWGINAPDYYLLDMTLRQMNFPATVDAILALMFIHPDVDGVIVEAKANGQAIIDTMAAKLAGFIPYNPGRDGKEARAIAAQYAVRSGHVHLPNPQVTTFMPSMLANLTKFPRAKHDDDVDALVQVILATRETAREFLFDLG